MVEIDIGILFGDVDHGIHKSEGVGVDDFRTLADSCLHDALCVRAFRHRLNDGAFYSGVFFFHKLTAEIVHVVVAAVGYRSDIDKYRFLILRLNRSQRKGLSRKYGHKYHCKYNNLFH